MTRPVFLAALTCCIALAPIAHAQYLVRDINPGAAGSDIYDMRHFGDRVVFNADDGLGGRELWVSDGTEEGTRPLTAREVPVGNEPYLWYEADGYFYFSADDGVNGQEVWRTDGTAAGTGLHFEFGEGEADSYLGFGGELQGFAIITAYDPQDNSNGLWRIENGSGDLNLVTTLPDGFSTQPNSFQRLGDVLLFWADDGVNGRELWRTDGTEAGTHLVKDVVKGEASGSYSSDGGNVWVGVANGLALFRSPEIVSGELRPALWVTDGSEAGTQRIYAAEAMYPRAFSFPQDGGLGSYVLFVGDTEAEGEEPWVSDGTTQGTRLLADIKQGTESSFPYSLPFLRGRQYFGAAGFQLNIWRTDGIIVEPVSAALNGFSSSGCAFGEVFVFGGVRLSDGTGFELWASDGTNAGTSLVADLNEGVSSSIPRSFVCLEDRAFFIADDGSHGRELWAVDASILVDNEVEATVPADGLRLSSPSPNPFHIHTSLMIEVSRPQQVQVEVYDVLGRRVSRLFDGLLAPGEHRIGLEGRGLADGVYVLRAFGERTGASRLVTHRK